MKEQGSESETTGSRHAKVSESLSTVKMVQVDKLSLLKGQSNESIRLQALIAVVEQCPHWYNGE